MLHLKLRPPTLSPTSAGTHSLLERPSSRGAEEVAAQGGRFCSYILCETLAGAVGQGLLGSSGYQG